MFGVIIDILLLTEVYQKTKPKYVLGLCFFDLFPADKAGLRICLLPSLLFYYLDIAVRSTRFRRSL
jgi:hypothetical protein